MHLKVFIVLVVLKSQSRLKESTRSSFVFILKTLLLSRSCDMFFQSLQLLQGHMAQPNSQVSDSFVLDVTT